jgi:hypothetical protein
VRCSVISATLLLISAVGLRADGADRGQLTGAWESHGDDSSNANWTLSVNGDKLHVTRVENTRKLSDFECNTAGRECAVKESGKPMKVSIWFNGRKLVMMETRGNDVVKRRFQAVKDGNEIEVEVIPIVPQGKPELLHLYRASASH